MIETDPSEDKIKFGGHMIDSDMCSGLMLLAPRSNLISHFVPEFDEPAHKDSKSRWNVFTTSKEIDEIASEDGNINKR